MKYISFVVLALMILASVDSFGQEAMTRSLSQTKETKTTKTIVGAFGETIQVHVSETKEAKVDEQETAKEQVRYFDLAEESPVDMSDLEVETETSKSFANVNLMDVMVINERNPWNIAPPKSEALLFHDAKIITNESGFFIQLLESNQILDKEHKIYQEFGNLRVESDINGNFHYLIGSFKTKEASESFLKNIILPRYPEAEVAEYQNGKKL